MHIKKSKPCFLLAPLCCSLAVTAEVMCSNTSSSSVAVIQGMMAWQTWSQMVHLGAPEAACWQDTHVTQETLLSSASASDTFVRSSSLICITDTLSGYVTHFFFFKIFELHTSILAFWGVIVNTIQKVKIWALSFCSCVCREILNSLTLLLLFLNWPYWLHVYVFLVIKCFWQISLKLDATSKRSL